MIRSSASSSTRPSPRAWPRSSRRSPSRSCASPSADLQQVLSGGRLQFLGQTVHLLGLRNARTIVAGTIAALPAAVPAAHRPAPGGRLRRSGHRWPGLRHARPGRDRQPADGGPDPARRPDHAQRHLRRGDRRDRLADVRHRSARRRAARPRAQRERLRAPHPGSRFTGQAAGREGPAGRRLCGAGHRSSWPRSCRCSCPWSGGGSSSGRSPCSAAAWPSARSGS